MKNSLLYTIKKHKVFRLNHRIGGKYSFTVIPVSNQIRMPFFCILLSIWKIQFSNQIHMAFPAESEAPRAIYTLRSNENWIPVEAS